MKKRSIFLLYLFLITGILWGNSMSVCATDKTAVQDSKKEQETKERIITGFQKLDTPYYEWKEKYPLKEALTKLPKALKVELGEKEEEMIEVTWKCTDDYEKTQLRVYEFVPYWDEEKYLLSNELDEYWDVPYIQVVVPIALTDKEKHDINITREDLQSLLEKETVNAWVYLCEKYEVKQQPATESKTVVLLAAGTTVEIRDVAVDEYRKVWYQISGRIEDKPYTGYIEKKNLAYSHAAFKAWEEEYDVVFSGYNTLENETDTPQYEDVEQFPLSYQSKLAALKKQHPTWIFMKQSTGLDWNTVITMESRRGYSIVSAAAEEAYKEAYYDSDWYYASKEAVSYYMDPRNFLNDTDIFQFEQLLESSASDRAEDYIAKGQDTLYLQKFNVGKSSYSLYQHQYTRNISAPKEEASKVKKAYKEADVVENTHIFKIPVYRNMPGDEISAQEADKMSVVSAAERMVITLKHKMEGMSREELQKQLEIAENRVSGINWKLPAKETVNSAIIIMSIIEVGMILLICILLISEKRKASRQKQGTEKGKTSQKKKRKANKQAVKKEQKLQGKQISQAKRQKAGKGKTR